MDPQNLPTLSFLPFTTEKRPNGGTVTTELAELGGTFGTDEINGQVLRIRGGEKGLLMRTTAIAPGGAVDVCVTYVPDAGIALVTPPGNSGPVYPNAENKEKGAPKATLSTITPENRILAIEELRSAIGRPLAEQLLRGVTDRAEQLDTLAGVAKARGVHQRPGSAYYGLLD